MSLSNENEAVECTDSGACNIDFQRISRERLEKSADKVQSVKVLGADNKNSDALFENTVRAVRDMGLKISVEYVSDAKEVTDYNADSTPAIVVNEKVISSGRVLDADDIKVEFRRFGF